MQSIWFFVQILFVIGPIGLIVSIIATIGLLLFKWQSSNAWTLSAGAAIVFFIGGIHTVWMDGGGITLTWANALAPIGGYFLLALALYQYMRDRKTTVIEERQ